MALKLIKSKSKIKVIIDLMPVFFDTKKCSIKMIPKVIKYYFAVHRHKLLTYIISDINMKFSMYIENTQRWLRKYTKVFLSRLLS